MSSPTTERDVSSAAPPATRMLLTLLRYKQWANRIAFEAVTAIPEDEALRPRSTTFGNMVHTLNHVYVIDDIFRHHLTGRAHGYTTRNTAGTPAIGDLWRAVEDMDRWYIDHVSDWTERDVSRVVDFEFVGGGRGAMTGEEIILHLVNHSTYHRGFLGDMLKQVPYNWPACDLTVFLRDHRPAA